MLRARPAITARARIRPRAGLYEEPMSIRHLATNVLELVAPLDETTVPPTPITTAVSCTGRLYDATCSYIEGPTTTVAEEVDPLEAEIEVASAFGFQATATVEIPMVSGVLHRTTIVSINLAVSPNTITLTAGPAAAIAPGETIRQTAYLAAATVLFVRHPERFTVGDTVAFRYTNGTRATFTVTGIGRHHLVVAATASPIAAGELIERKLGADVVLAVYNAANANAATDDWGFRGTIANNHADLRAGVLVAAEIELVTAALTTIERLTLPVLSR